jgi:hypothetical protein
VSLCYTGPKWMKQTLSSRARATTGPVPTTKKQCVKIDAKMEKGEGIFVGEGATGKQEKAEGPRPTREFRGCRQDTVIEILRRSLVGSLQDDNLRDSG